MNFKIHDEVIELASGRIAIIVGTKTNPYISPVTKTKIFPDKNNDYLIMFKVDENNYKGLNSVPAHNLIPNSI